VEERLVKIRLELVVSELEFRLVEETVRE